MRPCAKSSSSRAACSILQHLGVYQTGAWSACRPRLQPCLRSLCRQRHAQQGGKQMRFPSPLQALQPITQKPSWWPPRRQSERVMTKAEALMEDSGHGTLTDPENTTKPGFGPAQPFKKFEHQQFSAHDHLRQEPHRDTPSPRHQDAGATSWARKITLLGMTRFCFSN